VSSIWPARRYHSVLTDWLNPELLPELRLWRIPDRVTVELLRQDGSRVGELDGPELSIGQRCTAILAMVLARDNVPVIIDQPEEDLDNEFIYRELVPLIRRVKEQRQIIFVSHKREHPGQRRC
jgi:energy-coupling factor transporter ATP-binding protein EcfA2